MGSNEFLRTLRRVSAGLLRGSDGFLWGSGGAPTSFCGAIEGLRRASTKLLRDSEGSDFCGVTEGPDEFLRFSGGTPPEPLQGLGSPSGGAPMGLRSPSDEFAGILF